MSGGVKTFVFGEEPIELGLSRLSVELVPRSTWGDNLRSRFSAGRWDELRRAQYAAAGNRCEICGNEGFKQGYRWPVECHEVWSYDDAAHVQRLERLIALCPLCHQVKHFGRTVSEGKGERAIRHLMAVNSWTRKQADAHIAAAFGQWEDRSKHSWKLDISALEGGGLGPPSSE